MFILYCSCILICISCNFSSQRQNKQPLPGGSVGMPLTAMLPVAALMHGNYLVYYCHEYLHYVTPHTSLAGHTPC